MEIKFHRYAEIFPLMNSEEMADLVNTIQDHGQEDEIIMFEGRILDGRNRYIACHQLHIVPKIKPIDFASNEDALQYVLDHNLSRRHLSRAQKATVALEATEIQAELKAMADARKAVAGEKRASTASRNEKGTFTQLRLNSGEAGKQPQPKPDSHAGKVATKLAETFDTSRDAVEKSQRVKQQSQKLDGGETYKKVQQGEASLNKAEQELAEKEAPELQKKIGLDEKAFGELTIMQQRAVLSNLGVYKPHHRGNKAGNMDAFLDYQEHLKQMARSIEAGYTIPQTEELRHAFHKKGIVLKVKLPEPEGVTWERERQQCRTIINRCDDILSLSAKLDQLKTWNVSELAKSEMGKTLGLASHYKQAVEASISIVKRLQLLGNFEEPEDKTLSLPEPQFVEEFQEVKTVEAQVV